MCESAQQLFPPRRGRDYVMLKWGVFRHAHVDVELFIRADGNPYTALQGSFYGVW